MTDEIVYQRHIVTAFNENGGYGLKMSNAYLMGVPDLLLKLPYWPQPQVWEVKKVMRNWDTPFRSCKIDTTPLQRKTLIEMTDAGMQTAILVILPGPGRDVTLVMVRDVRLTTLDEGTFKRCRYVRKLGEGWHHALGKLNQLVP